MQSPRARRAILRRVFLIGGVLLGVASVFWQRAVLYRVRIENFADRQQHEYAWTGRRDISVDEYIRYKTEGHLVHKDGPAWQDLSDRLAADGEYHFFLPDHRPLSELAEDLDGSFVYVAIPRDDQLVYLDVVLSRPSSSPKAPSRLRYPFRRFAPGIFLAGFLGYFLVPWPKRDPDIVAYARFVGAMLPDIGIGILFVGTFFTLPWLVVPGEADTSHPLAIDGGWIILTSTMWGFCLFGLAIHFIAAWYETLSIHVAGDHVRVESLLGAETIAFSDIERLTLGIRQPPKTLVKAGFLLSLVNWRAAGPTLLVASRSDPTLCLVRRNGQTRSFSLTGIYHVERLVAACKDAQIPVDPEVESLIS